MRRKGYIRARGRGFFAFGNMTECQAQAFGESRIRVRVGRRVRIRDSRGADGRRSVKRLGALADILSLRRGGRADGVSERVGKNAVFVSFCRNGKRGGRGTDREEVSGNVPENAVPESLRALCGRHFSSLRQAFSVLAASASSFSARNSVFSRMAFRIFLEYGLQICTFLWIFMRFGRTDGALFLILQCLKMPFPCHPVSLVQERISFPRNGYE